MTTTNDQPTLQIPDEAVERIAAIFGQDQLTLKEGQHFHETIFAICQYVGQSIGLSFSTPKVLDLKLSFARIVKEIAKASGVRVRRIKLASNWWQQDAGPMVAMTLEHESPCGLIPIPSGGYLIVAPGQTTPIKVTAEVAESLYPLAFSFYRPLPDTQLTLKQIFYFALQDLWSDFGRLLTLQASISLLGLLIPIVSGIIMETVIPMANFTLLGHFIIALTVITFATTTFKVGQVISMMRLKFKTNVTVQSAVWDRVLRLPMSFFRKFTAGDLANRIGGIDAIQQTLTGTVLSGLIGGLFSLLTLGLMFFYDPIIAFMVLCLAFVGGLISLFGIYIQLKYQRQLLYLRGKNANLVFQFLNGISKLRAHARENAAFLRWSEKYARIAKVFKRSQIISIRMGLFRSLYGGIVMILFFLMVMARVDALSLGSFIALNAAMAQFQAAFGNVFNVLGQILNIIPLYERVQPILEAIPEQDKTGIDPGKLEGEVAFRNVSFYYNHGDPFVFADLNMTIRPGQFIALVGPSGAGKSTMFRLLLGFETPREGKILYDGKNLNTLNIRSLRRQLGVVLQTSSLRPGSILENILGHHLDLTMEDAWAAAKMAAIDQDIEALPMQMHTLVSEEGRTFSMGQRQRLMIARALVTRPRILLFDEATSALDNATQNIVKQNLEQLKITRIIAAHRLSTIIHADWIYVLNEKGRIVQQGKYKELTEQKGLFLELVKNQLKLSS